MGLELLSARLAGAVSAVPVAPYTGEGGAVRFTGLVKHELARLWTRRRIYVVLAGMALVGVVAIVGDSDAMVSTAAGTMRFTAPMLFLATVDQIAFLFIFWPVAIGGTTAEDVSSGLVTLLVTRAGSRISWINSKLAAATLTSLLGFTLIAGIWLGASVAVAPWDLYGLSGTVSFGGTAAASHPIAAAAGVVAILVVAGAALAMLSALIGILTASPLMSQIGSSVLYVAAILSLPPQINPLSRASMFSFQAPWMTPMSCAVYWIVVLAALSGAAYLAALRREAR